jgi:hypothetical protein
MKPLFITIALPFLWATAVSAKAQFLTQTVQLQPGWNAVWLELDPPDRTPAVVFAGIPTLGVWTWSERISATDFIQDPSGVGWNHAQWLSFFSPGTPEERLSNLYAILPQRAYLIKLAGTNVVNWSITGKPSLQNSPWSADRFNLRGFPIDPARPPTFLNFFRPSPAHYDASSGQLLPIYRLSPTGQWQRVQTGDLMRRDEAYWVYTSGSSTYVAPFSLASSTGEELNYDAVLGRASLTVQSENQNPENIQFAPVTGQPFPLLLVVPLADLQTNQFTPFTNYLQAMAPLQTSELTLALDRSQLSGTTNADGSYGSIYSAGDGLGTLEYFAVEAKASPLVGIGISTNVGLWVGTITITNVAQAYLTNNPTAPGAVPRSFPMRLLIHVDTNGNATLLRDVTLLYVRNRNGDTNYPNGAYSPGPTALITDPAVLRQRLSFGIDSSRLTGRRLSSAQFDFPTSPGNYQLRLTGVFAISNQLSGRIDLAADLPTNPFLHRYHPDHGTNQAYAVTREFSLAFALPDHVPPGTVGPAIGGKYSETITGLHRLPLLTSGSILLQRISDLGVLNDTTLTGP